MTCPHCNDTGIFVGDEGTHSWCNCPAGGKQFADDVNEVWEQQPDAGEE